MRRGSRSNDNDNISITPSDPSGSLDDNSIGDLTGRDYAGLVGAAIGTGLGTAFGIVFGSPRIGGAFGAPIGQIAGHEAYDKISDAYTAPEDPAGGSGLSSSIKGSARSRSHEGRFDDGRGLRTGDEQNALDALAEDALTSVGRDVAKAAQRASELSGYTTPSPNPSRSPDGFGQAVGERGERGSQHSPGPGPSNSPGRSDGGGHGSQHSSSSIGRGPPSPDPRSNNQPVGDRGDHGSAHHTAQNHSQPSRTGVASRGVNDVEGPEAGTLSITPASYSPTRHGPDHVRDALRAPPEVPTIQVHAPIDLDSTYAPYSPGAAGSRGASSSSSSNASLGHQHQERDRLGVQVVLRREFRDRSFRSLYCCWDGGRGRGAPV